MWGQPSRWAVGVYHGKVEECLVERKVSRKASEFVPGWATELELGFAQVAGAMTSDTEHIEATEPVAGPEELLTPPTLHYTVQATLALSPAVPAVPAGHEDTSS